jgi:heterodisulfide reductase subunit A
MITFILDGKEVQGQEGEYLLQVAERYGVKIPTLCHHNVLEPAGMCRLCTVEMHYNGRVRYVTACNYPIWDGMEIKTDTQTVHEGRKLIVELLLARCPDVPILQKLSKEYGIKAPRFKTEDDTCILCGLCTRICERMGNNAITLTGRGLDMKVDTPFHIQTHACIACGACATVCPTGHITKEKIQAHVSKHELIPILSEYDTGLVGRKPIYVPYAQAIPNTPVIDRDRCVHFKTGGCKICSEVCGVNAIDYTQEDEIVELDVGSIIIAPGSQAFDPAVHDTFGYTKDPNIVTSLEFERILSASGPYGGHLVRPSDGKKPEKIAWLQCIGSRDEHLGAQGYCSGVCCTYAIKEAMLAKEHSKKDLDTTVFYIDMRTHGKDFERYYNRAKDEMGVRFIKSKITNVTSNDETGMQVIRYVDESGRKVDEEFDIVVLSVGLMVSPKGVDLAKRLGVDVDHYNFARTRSFEPVESSIPGIYVCGAFESPKDIPASVIDSSAAAGVVGSKLAESRWTLTKTKHVPEEIDLHGELPRVGVFVCRCGTNIAGVVDVPAVGEFAKSLPGVVYVEENMFSCSQDTQEQITQVIKEQKLNRVVVAACTPRTHEPLFQETILNAGINKYLFEMANIRNQCSWVHSKEREAATEKAKDLVRMAVSKVGLLQPLSDPEIEMNPSALVIGGGLAGITTANNLAKQGYVTHLIEKNNVLGGQALNLYETWQGEDVRKKLAGLIKEAESDKNINILTNTQIKEVNGFVGNFRTTVETGGKEQVIEHGVAIIATGAEEFKPDQYLYGEDPRVLTGLELDRKFIDDHLPLTEIHTAVFIQCVGSRIKERPYCSKVCCTHSVKNALKLKQLKPEIDVFIIYRDMRTYGLREDLYREARSKGIAFIHYDFNKELTVSKNQNELNVRCTSYVLQREVEIRPDLLVLATPIVPPRENPVSSLFKVPVNEDGFFAEAHVKLQPLDFATKGVFVCGLAHSPKPVDEAIAQGLGAASRAATLLSQKKVLGNAIVSRINAQLCRGCQKCMAVCPYQAINFLEDRGICEVNPAVCTGCGSCAVACPTGAASVFHFDDQEVLTMVRAAFN